LLSFSITDLWKTSQPELENNYFPENSAKSGEKLFSFEESHIENLMFLEMQDF